MPDRIVILPGNRIYFVEAKFGTNGLQPGQVERIKELRALGCEVLEIATAGQVDWFIEVYAKGA